MLQGGNLSIAQVKSSDSRTNATSSDGSSSDSTSLAGSTTSLDALETPEEIQSLPGDNSSALAPPRPPKKDHFAQFNGSLGFLTWQVSYEA